MSFGAYLGGLIGIGLVLAPIGLAAVQGRRRLLPGWVGAPARLAEVVLGASILTVVLQLLAVAGALGPWTLIASSLVIGGVAIAPAGRRWRLTGLCDRKVASGRGATPPAPSIPRLHLIIALGAAAFLAAHWATGLQDVWARGMLTFDTLWYHGPFAARIAESGSVWGLHYTDPLYLNWFYPQNSELLHGAGIALFDRDLLSPLVNFAWLGVGLLAAWCIGRPYGVAPLSLLAVVLVFDTGPFVPREAGTPANDVAPASLLLAAAAVLINAWRSRAPEPERGPPASTGVFGDPRMAALLLAGLAMGLALGTKLTIAGAVAAMAVGAPLIVPPGIRRLAGLVFLGGVAATAGIWFVRNLIHSGNPLPWFAELGPIDLPGPDRGLEGRDNFTVAHYIFVAPDTGVWSQYFFTPITNLFGPGWFLFLGLAPVGALLAILRPRTSAVRLLGAVAVAGAIAYLFTPLTAAGPEGEPLAFGINLRYLLPALALALALLTLEPRLTPERLRLPLLGAGVVVLAVTSLYSDSAYIWDEPFASIPVAALIGIALIGAPVALALLARRDRRLLAGAAALLALLVGAVGWERQDDYLADRYTRSDDFRFQLDRVAGWAKPTSGERIGIAGTSGAFSQYVLYGDELANRVEFIGRELPAGDFRTVANPEAAGGRDRGPGKCPEFRRFVNRGDYDYVVTTPKLDLNDPRTASPAPEGGWLRDDRAAEEILREGRTSVFRITGRLEESGCPRSGAEVAGS